jgi:hypothetical protein
MSDKWYAVERIPTVSIKEFAACHGLRLVVRERRVAARIDQRGPDNRFYATFDGAEIKGDGVLIGMFGNGATIDEAIQAYAREISVHTLVVDAYREARREVIVPRLFHDTEDKNA